MDRAQALDMKNITGEDIFEVLKERGWGAAVIDDFYNDLQHVVSRRKDMRQATKMTATDFLMLLENKGRVVKLKTGNGVVRGPVADARRADSQVVFVIDNRAYIVGMKATIEVYPSRRVEGVEALNVCDGVDMIVNSTMIESPTEPGFYKYSGGNQNMIFLLEPRQKYQTHGQWTVMFSNGQYEKCEWGYIEQALSVWDLVKI